MDQQVTLVIWYGITCLLQQGYGGMNGFLCSMLLSHLLQKKKVSRPMSSYQMLRVVWTYLSTSDWTREGATMATEDDGDKVCSSWRVGLWRC